MVSGSPSGKDEVSTVGLFHGGVRRTFIPFGSSSFCTNFSISACFSGGNPKKKSPRLSEDIPRSAALIILDSDASKLRPANKHPMHSMTKLKSPHILSRSSPSAHMISVMSSRLPPSRSPLNDSAILMQTITNICSSSDICMNLCSFANSNKESGVSNRPVYLSNLDGSIISPISICLSLYESRLFEHISLLN